MSLSSSLESSDVCGEASDVASLAASTDAALANATSLFAATTLDAASRTAHSVDSLGMSESGGARAASACSLDSSSDVWTEASDVASLAA